MYAQLMASYKINLLTWFWDYTDLLTQRYLDQTNLEMCDHKIPAFCINNHRCYKHCINSSPLCSGMSWYSLAGLNPWTTKLYLNIFDIAWWNMMQGDMTTYSGRTHMDICMMNTTAFCSNVFTLTGTCMVLTKFPYIIGISTQENKYILHIIVST